MPISKREIQQVSVAGGGAGSASRHCLYIRLGIAAVGTILLPALVLRYTEPVRPRDLIRHVWCPIFSTVIMAVALNVVPRFVFPPLNLQVAFTAVFGAAVYVCAILILWHISGWSDGAETYLFEQLCMKERFLKWRRVSE